MSAFECNVQVKGRVKEIEPFVSAVSKLDDYSTSVIDEIDISDRVKNIVNVSFTSSVLRRELLIDVVQEWSQTFRYLKFEASICDYSGREGKLWLAVEDGMLMSMSEQESEAAGYSDSIEEYARWIEEHALNVPISPFSDDKN